MYFIYYSCTLYIICALHILNHASCALHVRASAQAAALARTQTGESIYKRIVKHSAASVLVQYAYDSSWCEAAVETMSEKIFQSMRLAAPRGKLRSAACSANVPLSLTAQNDRSAHGALYACS